MKKLPLGLKIQFVMSIILLILLVITIFNHNFLVFSEIMMGLTLLVMAYNNQTFYKRKNLTIIYIVFGVLVILMTILKAIYG